MKNTMRLLYILLIAVLLLSSALLFSACGEEEQPKPDPTPDTIYTVRFDPRGGSGISDQKIKAGQTASAPTAPTREGHTFLFWTLEGEQYDFSAPVTKDITLVANWKETGPFTVTFCYVNADGTATQTVEQIEITEAATAPAVPQRPGYEFTGWDKTFDRVTSDMTVTAQYVRLWTVIFYDMDGTTVLDTVEVRDGEGATAPEAPAKAHFTFTGWNAAFDRVTNNLSVTAVYEEDAKYTVKFVNYDASLLKEESVYGGEAATAPTMTPVREGYTFIGWDKTFDNITENTIITACFSQNPAVYTVSFDTLGNGTIGDQHITEGGSAVKPNDPVREGHTFTGWTLNGETYDFNSPVTADIILIASYERIIPTYTVSFDTLGNGTIGEQSIKEGETATKPKDPVREGYTFTGWTLNGETYDFNSPVTASITLVASYEEIPGSYTVTYTDENGNILKTQTINPGETPTPPPAPYKAHYALEKWEMTTDAATGNVTYRANYALVRHVVTFAHANGTGDTTPITVDDCTAVTAAPTAPAYSGFRFLYWTHADGTRYDFSTLVTKDITLYAKYEVDTEIPAATTDFIFISPGYLEFWSGLELQLNIQATTTYTESATKVSSATTDVHYDGFTYTFYTDNTDVLTIAADGTITPVSLGTARVWAIIHQGGTQTYAADVDYTKYDTFTVPDGTVIAAIEVRIIDKPDYLKLNESDPENQQIQLEKDKTPRIDINDFLSMPAGEYGSANIALWYNDATAVMTITVDDNIVGDFVQWSEWSQTYGTPISIMAITREYTKYVNRWADLTASGNEVQPHGHSHHSAQFYKSGYLTSAQAWYDSYISKQVIEACTDERVLVFSYPCGYNADFNKYLYIGGRGVSYLPVNSSNINYNSVDLQSIPTEENFAALFDPTLSASHFPYGGWMNFLQHNIGTDKSKYEVILPLAKERIDSGELWAALFSDACQYGQERDTATIINMNAGADMITFGLTDKMNDLLFDHALTVKIKVDSTWLGARAYQNGTECETHIVTEGDNTYVYVNAVPDKGEVKVIRSAVENLTETVNRISFTPTGIVGGEGESKMTLGFAVDGTVWTGGYATQNGTYIPTTISTKAGVTTVTVIAQVNGGEVIITPLTDQYDMRESLTMYEVWSGFVTPDGTKPVLISTPDDLIMLSDYVMHRGVTAGVTFRLTNNIDMANVENFRPIGWQTDPTSNGDQSAKSAFSGVFDGSEHTVYNLTVNQPGLTYVGLFGFTENATITRLNVIGEVEGLGRVGGIAGRMIGGTMNGVTFEGSVISRGDAHFEWTGSRVGGLVGQLDGVTMRNCAAYASVVAFPTDKYGMSSPKPNGNINASSYVGGIVGEVFYQHQVSAACVFDNIVFDGTVTAYTSHDGKGADHVGGFAGIIGQSTLTNITIHADVTGNTRVGGFVGYLTHRNFIPATYKNCAVSGTVTGNDYVGGFAGMIDANNTQKLYNCISTAVVNASGTAVNVGALYGTCPYGGQNTTSNGIYYIEALNPGMVVHPGTIKEPTKYCVAVESIDAAIERLNTYAGANNLPAWRLLDGNPSASYFPVFTVTILDKDGNILEEQAVGNTLNVILPEAPFITGFEFEGWNGNTTGITANGTIQMIYRSVETFTVTFTDMEGNAISTQTINTGRGATAPEPQVYERYWFVEWGAAFDRITSNLTVNPVYTNAYYVTFNYKAEDGTDTSVSVKTAEGADAVAPAIPAIDGLTFNGWDHAFDNVTSDMTVTAQYMTVTAGPLTVNILQWTLTTAPSEAYFNMLTGSEVIIYTGSTDLSNATLPTGWAALGNKNAGQDTSIQYSGIIYNTSKYRFDEAADTFAMSLASYATNAYVFAVPLLDIATNQQVVVASLTLGTWAAPAAFGEWGKTERTLKAFLPSLTEQYSAASGIVIGLCCRTKDTNTGYLNNYTTCDDKKDYVEGYDLVGQYEVATDTKAEYVLTFMKDGREATISNATVVNAATDVSTNNGARYSITFDDAEATP